MSEQTEIIPGSDEYNQMMAAKAQEMRGTGDEAPTEEPQIPQMPEGGHEKFYNAETGEYDWKSHSVELQYRLDQAKVGDKENLSPPPQPEGQEETQEVSDIVTKAGLSMDELSAQVAETGALSDDSVNKLVAQGIPKELIESYVENAKVAREAALSRSLEYVGGQEAWESINKWAETNLSGSERQMYNQMLKGPEWTVAVDALKQKMGTAAPTANEGKLVTGGEISTTPGGYRSKAEMSRDMQSPEYRTDPAFRAKVMQKMQTATWDLDNF